jgi:hypothetical protein
MAKVTIVIEDVDDEIANFSIKSKPAYKKDVALTTAQELGNLFFEHMKKINSKETEQNGNNT